MIWPDRCQEGWTTWVYVSPAGEGVGEQVLPLDERLYGRPAADLPHKGVDEALLEGLAGPRSAGFKQGIPTSSEEAGALESPSEIAALPVLAVETAKQDASSKQVPLGDVEPGKLQPLFETETHVELESPPVPGFDPDMYGSVRLAFTGHLGSIDETELSQESLGLVYQKRVVAIADSQE